MKKKDRAWTLVALLAAVLVAAPQAARGGEEKPGEGLDQTIKIQLAGAAAEDVFNSFAGILHAAPVLDPELEGQVTIELADVSVRTTLNAVCEMLDCKWWLEEGPPQVLRVKANAGARARAATPPGSLDHPVTLSLRDAPAEEVFRSFASIGHWKLALEKPTVSIELENTPVREALDQVCAQIACVWSLDQVGDEGVLRVNWIE